MASRRLQSLGLDSYVLERLQKCRITTCKHVLCRCPADLMDEVNLLPHVVQEIITRASTVCAPVPVSALSLNTGEKNNTNTCSVLPTSLENLDRLLHGGISVGSITEITGPPGCGKTQFSMMLAVTCAAINQSSSVIYIDTEAAFSPDRLLELAISRYPELHSNEESLEELARRILIFTELTCNLLMKRLENLEADIISHNVKLIVVDSIASPVRKEFDPGVRRNMAARSSWLMNVASLLKYIASTFSIPILITNQITTRNAMDSVQQMLTCDGGDVIDDDDVQMEDTRDVSNGPNVSSCISAALGNSWSHCVNTRLILQYLDEDGSRRQLLIAKSPVAPFTRFVYTIQDSGIVLEEDSVEYYSGTDPNHQRIATRSLLNS